MANRLRQAAAPLYLFLCLILGGSVQGIFANMFLQLVGIGLIAWAVVSPSVELQPSSERQLYGLIFIALVLVIVQLVPLPPSIWPSLGGRSELAAGYRVLNLQIPWLPISVAPYDSIATLLTIIPPVALLMTILKIGARPVWLVSALFAALFAGILLGLLQISSLGAQPSPWYLYEETNVGTATGFFANSNHMATLLLISIPFLAAVVSFARRQNVREERFVSVAIVVIAAFLLVVLGIALNRSLAGYCLALPVVLCSLLLLFGARSPLRGWLVVGAGILLVGALAVLLLAPVRSGAIQKDATDSAHARYEMLSTTAEAARAFLPLGSGLGTFRRVYALYEDHDRLDPTIYVVHAHDDYVELALETGVPGMVVLILFLLWWGRLSVSVWSASDSGPFARAAAIASATILIHSIADYPLRTAAISTCFAMCLALLIRWRHETSDQADLRPTRHVVIG